MEGESSDVQQAQSQVGQDKNQQQDGQEPGVDAQTGQKQASGSRRRTPQWWQNEGYSLSHGAQSKHRLAFTLNMAEETNLPH